MENGVCAYRFWGNVSFFPKREIPTIIRKMIPAFVLHFVPDNKLMESFQELRKNDHEKTQAYLEHNSQQHQIK